MANIKTTPDEWAKAREYYEAGLLLREIEDKTGIAIPNISKKAAKDGWSKAKESGQKQKLIIDDVRVREAKAKLDPVALAVHNEIVEEKTKDLILLNSFAMQNVSESMKLQCTNQLDHVQRSNTILKTKETLVGKTPETAIQINNTQQLALTAVELRRLTPEEYAVLQSAAGKLCAS